MSDLAMEIECSPFKLLDMPAVLDLDIDLLESNYLDQQQQWHPDRFVNASDVERDYATQKTAALNTAYSLLKDPLSRAEFLLKYHTGPFGPQEADCPQTLLIQVMEVKERIESLNPTVDLQALADEVQLLFKQSWKRMQKECEDKDWVAAKEKLFHVKYWKKLAQEIDSKRISRNLS